MKTNMFYKGVFILGTIMLSVACSSSKGDSEDQSNLEKKQMAGLTVLGTEDTINVDLDTIEQNDAYTRWKDMTTYVKAFYSNSMKTLAKAADSVDKSTLLKWEQEAISTHTVTGDSRPYLPALSISYGLVSGQKQMHMMFEPICLHRISIDSTTGIATYTLEPRYSGKTYACSSPTHTYTVVSVTDFSTAYVTTYTTNIRIAHTRNTNKFDKFLKDTDALAAIYPFQEVLRILQDNGKDTLKIWNIANDAKFGNRTYLIHNLLLSSSNLDISVQDSLHFGPFYGKFGDLSHLCPPSCYRFKYQLRNFEVEEKKTTGKK